MKIYYKAIGWGALGAAIGASVAAFGYVEGWKDAGIALPGVWPDYATAGILGWSVKCFLFCGAASLARSFFKKLPPNPNRRK